MTIPATRRVPTFPSKYASPDALRLKAGPVVVRATPIRNGVHTFARWRAGVRLVFQRCTECCTIRANNPWT